MKSLPTYVLALGFFLGPWIPAHAVEPLSPSQETANTDPPDLFLIAIFSDVIFINGGISANVTNVNQNISFLVVPTRLIDFEHSEELPLIPEIHFAVNDQAFANQGPSHYIQTCLNLIRELLVNKNTGLEMTLHLRVKRVRSNTSIREFLGCQMGPVGR